MIFKKRFESTEMRQKDLEQEVHGSFMATVARAKTIS